MSSLYSLGQQLAATLAPELIAPTIAATLAEALQANRVTVWQAQAANTTDGNSITLLALHEIVVPSPLAATRRKTPRTTAPDALFFKHSTKHRLVLTVHHRADVVGWLIIERDKSAAAFDKPARNLARAFADQIGPALNLIIGFNEVLRSREQIVLAREEERRMLRRELHNAIGPSLAALDLRVGALAILARQLTEQAGASTDDITQKLSAQTIETRQQLRKIIADLRRVIYDLRPALLDELGLVAAIQEQALQFSQGALSVQVNVPNTVLLLPAAVEVAAYKIIIEALSNVARHAEATRAEINLAATSTGLVIDIVDNGKGIATQQRPGVGLGSMNVVSTQLGGHVIAKPMPSGGTHVHAVIPCSF